MTSSVGTPLRPHGLPTVGALDCSCLGYLRNPRVVRCVDMAGVLVVMKVTLSLVLAFRVGAVAAPSSGRHLLLFLFYAGEGKCVAVTYGTVGFVDGSMTFRGTDQQLPPAVQSHLLNRHHDRIFDRNPL